MTPEKRNETLVRLRQTFPEKNEQQILELFDAACASRLTERENLSDELRKEDSPLPN